jgi:transposase
VPAPRARQIIVTAAERRRLEKLAYSRTAGHQQVIRARIVLDAARGYSNAEISRRRGVVADTVRLWRGRYADEGIAGLADRRRSGRPPRFTPVQAAEVKALACQLPAETGAPLSRWSCPDLAGEITGRGIAPAMSASTVRRILAADTIKPWQYRSWLFIRDPDFAAKATRVLDLYARVFGGSPLGDGEYVISSDEKTSIQARCRCHPTLPPGTSGGTPPAPPGPRPGMHSTPGAGRRTPQGPRAVRPRNTGCRHASAPATQNRRAQHAGTPRRGAPSYGSGQTAAPARHERRVTLRRRPRHEGGRGGYTGKTQARHPREPPARSARPPPPEGGEARLSPAG